MANAEISQYHKYIDLQNVSSSGDPASAPAGGIYLFASGTAGNAKLYLQNEGVGTPLSLADGGTLAISDGNGGTDTVNLSGDTFTLTGSSGLTSAVTDNQASFSVNVDDSSIEIAGDKLQVKDGGIATAMLADDAVDADKLASNAVVNASIASNAAIDMDKLDGGSLASSLSDLAQGDLLYAGDVDDSNNLKSITFSNFEDAIFGNVSGQAAIAAGGALSLDVAAITGQTEMTGDVADADEFMISDGGVLKRVDFSVVRDAVFGDVSSEISIAAGGAATVANNVIDESNLKASVAGDGLAGGNGTALSVAVSGAVVVASDKVGLSGSVAGDGLGFTGGINSISALSVNVDDSTVEVNSDSLRVKADGIDSQHIALGALDSEHYSTGSIESNHLKGSVANAKLANSSVTLTQGAGMAALGEVALGASITVAVDGVLEDLDTLGAASADGEFIVATGAGAFAYESGNTARTSLGLGTGDSPQFTGVTVGTLSATGDVDLGDATSDTITATGRFDSDLVPSTDSARALGTSGLQWSAIHVDVGHIDQLGSALDANDQAITNINVDGGAIDGVTIGTNSAVSQLTASIVQVNTGLFPDAAGGATLGNASLGFGDVFIADDKALHFGNDQDVKMEYDEDGNDEFKVTIPAAGMRLQGTTPTLIVGDGGGEDTKLIFDGQAVDFHVGLDDSADKLSLGLGQTPGATANMLLDGASRDVEFLGNISVPQTKIISLDTDGDTSLRASADDTLQLRAGGSDMVTVLSTGMGVNGGYGTGNGSSFGADGTGNFDGNLNVGSDGSGASLTVHGAAANERMFFNSATNSLAFNKDNGSGGSETVVTIGGDADTDFAIEVANGSDNINKIKAAAFVTYSDESLKSDVTSMGSTALDAVMSLNGVEFTWKDSGERDFGFIAQEVEKVVPKAVHTGGDGVQGVDYSRLTSVLVEAVKAQQVQIEELKAILKK